MQGCSLSAAKIAELAAFAMDAKSRSARAFEAQSQLLEELEVSMLLQSHEDAKADLLRSEVDKVASSKLKAKHCESTSCFPKLACHQENLDICS